MALEEDVKTIKKALRIILIDKMNDEMYDAEHVETEKYDGCGCSNVSFSEDPKRVLSIKKKYDGILKDLE
jgi:hypothetical protein